MVETTTGIRRILSYPAVYDFWSRAVGGRRAQILFVRDHVRPRPDARVLDLGCGTGELLDYLGGVDYTGVDLSAEYIARARKRYGAAKFLLQDATSVGLPPRAFDLVLAVGVLHHLDDGAARRLLGIGATALRPDGRMIALDPTLLDGQSPLARFTIARDRGRNVRMPEAYARLAEEFFGAVSIRVRSDLIRIPYTHCVLECETPKGQEDVFDATRSAPTLPQSGRARIQP
jgi:SAM-dependent methyltransferase